MSQLMILILGGVGAIVAIVLKEVIQAAIKRQILLGQLHAYIMQWHTQVIRQPLMARLNSAVEDREQKIFDALKKGRSAATQQIAENLEQRDKVRAKIKEEILSAAQSNDGFRKTLGSAALLGAAVETLVASRQHVVDGKTFLSDGDAALLGPAIASGVVQLRASTVQMLLAFEGLIRVVQSSSEENRHELMELVASVIDSIILDGEQFLISLSRLNTNVERDRQLNLFQHSVNIIRGR